MVQTDRDQWPDLTFLAHPYCTLAASPKVNSSPSDTLGEIKEVGGVWLPLPAPIEWSLEPDYPGLNPSFPPIH